MELTETRRVTGLTRSSKAGGSETRSSGCPLAEEAKDAGTRGTGATGSGSNGGSRVFMLPFCNSSNNHQRLI